MTNHHTISTLISTLLLGGFIIAASTVYAASPVTNLEYDPNGNNTKVTDGLSHATTQQYDAVDRLIQQNQPHPSSTGQLGQIKTQFNGIDQVTGVTDPRNNTTTYTKDAFGNILTKVSPDTGTTTYTYDLANHLKTKTDALGTVASYIYDALNRLSAFSFKVSGATEEYIALTYDQGTNGLGRLTDMTDMSGETTWAYNAAGQVLRKQQRIGSNQIYNLEMQYDTAGRLSRMIYPSTRYIDYGYNTNGQVKAIIVDGISMINNIVYYPTGSIKSYSWGNGKTYQRTLDADGRPTSFTLGPELQLLTYDNAGNITQTSRALPATPTTPITGSTTNYYYDNLDRLTSYVTNSSSQSYQYDLSGNRTNLAIGSNNYAYTISSTNNRLTAEAGPTIRTYTYDPVGNITGNGQDVYSYYGNGHLKQVTRSGTNIYGLRYNGLGQFVLRTNDGTRFLYDENQHLIGEYTNTGEPIQETVYLGDTPVLTIKPDSQNRTADNTDTATTNKAVATGTWTTATAPAGYYGSNYTSHAAAASTTDQVVYTITPTATQSFKVYARWAAQSTNASNVSYTIAPNTPGSTPTTVTANQTVNGGVWNYLGTFNLNTANNLTVTLSGQGNGIVVADAVRIVPNVTANVQNNTYFIHTDHLNTPRVIVDQNNQKRWTWYAEASEAFGAYVANDNPASLGTFTYNLRFPGQLYDLNSQLSYNYYRDYNPRTGRYLESDPIGLAGGINTYGYVSGNPLSYIDPEGLAGVGTGQFSNNKIPNAGAVAAVSVAVSACVTFPELCPSAARQAAKYCTQKNRDKNPSTPVGRKGNPLNVEPGTNEPTNIGGRDYTGHSLDRMQGRGVPPSVVEDAIQNGQQFPGNKPNTTVSIGDNGVTVVTGANGQVITVIPK